MEFFEVIRRRRSIRRFREDPVPEEHLNLMLGAALLAPNATNEQPWRFLVVRSQKLLKELAAMVEAQLELRLEAAPEAEKEWLRYMRRFTSHWAKAPTVFFVLGRPWPARKAEPPLTHYDPGLQSVAAATTQLILAATALGYGSCWTTAAVDFAGPELEALLGVKPPWRLKAVVPVGKALREPPAPPKRSLEEVVTYLP